MLVQDYRNRLYAFMHSHVPSVNTLDSLYLCQQKVVPLPPPPIPVLPANGGELVQPIIYGKLKAIQTALGKDEFPLIEQAYVRLQSTLIQCIGWTNLMTSPMLRADAMRTGRR